MIIFTFNQNSLSKKEKKNPINYSVGGSSSGSSRESTEAAAAQMRARIEELERENQSLRQLLGSNT